MDFQFCNSGCLWFQYSLNFKGLNFIRHSVNLDMEFLWNGERWRGGSKWELQNRVYSSQIQFWIWKARGPSAEISKMYQDTVQEMKYQIQLWKCFKIDSTSQFFKIEIWKIPHISVNQHLLWGWDLCFFFSHQIRLDGWEKLSSVSFR